MKISTKGRYGLRAMLDLALNSSVNHVSLCSIAERQNISESYLEQMFSTLRKAELVKSVKGAQGGYILSASPSKIMVGTILRALEGSLSVISEDNNLNLKDTDKIEFCLRNSVWTKLNESISSIVDSITLEDLINDFKKMTGDEEYMYYI
jgi:Rrf2 family transcriptional regulator, cysteine metabolism repressor